MLKVAIAGNPIAQRNIANVFRLDSDVVQIASARSAKTAKMIYKRTLKTKVRIY